jgi:S1-C subfamily serine protease
MNLVDTFEKIRPSIVAFGSKLTIVKGTKPPSFPPLIGTGFIADERGIVITNRHVAEALRALPRAPDTNEPGAFALVFSEVIRHEQGDYGIGAAFVELIRYDLLTQFSVENGEYYGEAVPDLAFIQLNIRDVPALRLATAPWSIRIGTSVATAGFPLGTDPLVVYGGVNQITPFLRHGIVSSLLPFPCPTPHGFTVDIMSQGGASGSPIFRTDDGAVVGVLHAGFPGTNITLAVPANIAAFALETFFEQVKPDLTGVPTFAEYTKAEGPHKPTFRRAG